MQAEPPYETKSFFERGWFMKKLFVGAIITVSVLLPLWCSASFIIFLKDGGRILVDTYSEEGDMIRVKKYGGIMGIPRESVSRIEEVETETIPEVKKVQAQKAADPVNQKEKVVKQMPVEILEEGKKKIEQDTAAKMQKFLGEKRQIIREMERIALALKDGKANNNKAVRRKLLTERATLLNKLSDLEESVKAGHGGKLPDWWEDDL